MMNRLRTGLALGLLAFLGVVQAEDATISFKNRATKKSDEITGAIEEENFAGVKIKNTRTKETKLIPGVDIERVMFKVTFEPDKITYRIPFNSLDKAKAKNDTLSQMKTLESTATPVQIKKDEDERKRVRDQRDTLLTAARDGFVNLEKEGKNSPAAQRYFQFKIAEVIVLTAKYDPTKNDLAVKALTEFKAKHKEGWELPLVLEALAKMQEEDNKLDDARKTYEELAELPGAPEEIKQQSGILVGKLYLRGRQFKEAEGRLSKVVESMSGANPQKPLVQAYLIESQLGQDKLTTAQKDLDALIRATPDLRFRSVAYALLGDYYLKKGQPTEAFWSYLRVDAQYNEDAEAQARALYQLSQLFDKVKKDPRRGKECLTRLLDKRFEGTSYQKLAQASSKKE